MRQPLFWALRSRLGRPLSLPFFQSGAMFSTASTMDTRLELGELFLFLCLILYANIVLEIKPHTYTSGRWLRRDKLEIDSRYFQFNFGALCQKIIELCPEASYIKTCRKVEGGFNRVFVFTLDTAKTIVARLPFRLAGPAKLTTISEVATVRYCKSIAVSHHLSKR